MKIQKSNYISSTQFKSKFFETLMQPANLKKPLNKMTVMDTHCLLSYINSLKFRVGMTQGEIKELLSKRGLEFIKESEKFFKQKIGFSDTIVPPIILMEGSLGGAPSCYILEQNAIYLTDTFENIPKAQLFGLLRHEYQHAIQNHNILRTENLGDEAVESYTEKTFNKQKEILLNYAKNYSVKELMAQGLITDYGVILVSELSRALQSNDTIAVDNILKEFRKSITLGLNEFKEKVIREKGIIKAGTKAAEVAEKHFREFIDSDCFDKNGDLDIGKHSFRITEGEAECSQLMAESELSNSCYIRLLKNNIKESFNDKKIADSIENEYGKFCKN